MTSLKQIEANRRNAARSTGPTSQAGKQHSRCNAVRHGLTAETVIEFLENAEDYKAFELSVTADFEARTAVERELVLRLAGLLWRLRRASAIESGLLQLHSANQTAEDGGSASFRAAGVRMKELVPTLDPNIEYAAQVHQHNNTEIAECFLTLNHSDSNAFERLNRYETALWRQVGQLLVTLEFLRRYPPS
jgi:hypothetical protein